jgi:GNAT superfamily N-acetyltransferase
VLESSAWPLALAVPADTPAITALVNAAYRGVGSGATGWTSSAHLLAGPRIDAGVVRALLTRDDVACLVARTSDELLGCVVASYVRAGVGDIGLLAVSPRAQVSGLGRRLLASAEQVLVTRWRVERAELTVLSPRPELENWYRRRGYTETGRRRRLGADSAYGTALRDDLELIEFARPINALTP